MIEAIIELLPYVTGRESELIAQAKGVYKIPTSLKEIVKQNKTYKK